MPTAFTANCFHCQLLSLVPHASIKVHLGLEAAAAAGWPEAVSMLLEQVSAATALLPARVRKRDSRSQHCPVYAVLHGRVRASPG